ncbi:MAG: DUF3800 domain-containing protein [Candidatus Pacearchaeota archaeon]
MSEEQKEHTHEVYSDESGHNQGKYGAISAISLEKELVKKTEATLKEIFEESNVEELKWSKIRSAKYRLCAEKVIDFIFSIFGEGNLRIDIAIWDVKERKSKYLHNNTESLKRMNHQLFKNILSRWPKESRLKFFPDRHEEINWEKMKEILDYVIPEGREISIEEIPSKDFFLGQVADLFSGLGSFSHSNKDIRNFHSDQKQLPNSSKDPISNSKNEKIRVLSYFKRKAKEKGYNVEQNGILHTKDPKDPLNFWPFKFKDYANKKLSEFF